MQLPGESVLVAVPVTRAPAYHFFGYYDKFQVDPGGERLLTMAVDFMDRPPRADDTARIGVIDLAHGNALALVAETQAWCWQQSCMLQWFPGAPTRKIVFNVREGGQFAACVLDLATGRRRLYERPVYTIASDGRFALCPNFSRLAAVRPGYGYEGVPDPWAAENAPADDGIYRLDFKTGRSRLIISLAQIAASLPAEERTGYTHWFNHLLISPDDRRFIFLHRWNHSRNGWRWQTRLFTAGVDGSDIRCLNDHGMTSHFIWRDERSILAYANRWDSGCSYYVFGDGTGEIRPLARERLCTDGHMSYRPQRDWFVTDTYPQGEGEPRRHLLLYHEPSGECVEIGAYAATPKVAPVYPDPARDSSSCRCDLHPRWSRDGRSVTFDSVHEGYRQVYRVDVSSVVGVKRG